MLTPSIFFTLTVFHTHLHTRSPIDLCKDRPLAGPLLSFILCLPRVVIPFVSPVSPSDVFHCLQQQPHGDEPATVTSGASVMLIPSPPLVNNLPSFFYLYLFAPPFREHSIMRRGPTVAGLQSPKRRLLKSLARLQCAGTARAASAPAGRGCRLEVVATLNAS